jgi:hypothetical protein
MTIWYFEDTVMVFIQISDRSRYVRRHVQNILALIRCHRDCTGSDVESRPSGRRFSVATDRTCPVRAFRGRYCLTTKLSGRVPKRDARLQGINTRSPYRALATFSRVE